MFDSLLKTGITKPFPVSDSLYNLSTLLYAQVAACYDRKVVLITHCVPLSI